MTIKLKIIIKYLLTFSLLFFSFYLIFLGYSSLDILHKKNFIDKNNELKNEKILITDSNKKITELKKENNESNILQDEIILTVKKNDTFGILINKYILDSSLQNKLIYNLNDFYDLKKLKIGQKIYLYKNIDSVDINKIIIPINFFYGYNYKYKK